MSPADRKALEPDDRQILLYEYDLSDVLTILRSPRWPTASVNPAISALEKQRAALLAIVQSSMQGIVALRKPSAHENDKPEDCPCRACRDQVDAWHLAYHGSLELTDPSDHPKANPERSERELMVECPW